MPVDEKITQITEGSAIVDADLFPIVQNVATTPVTRSKTGTIVKAWLKTYFDTLYGSATIKYIITPSVASNNLTLALKYIDGTDPSSTKKLTFRVGNTEYDLTAAMSFTKNAATNWCNLGSVEMAALPHDLFVYAIGETGASAGLKFGFSRIASARTMADFVNTATSEKYIAGNWTNFNSTDAVTNIGRFRAQLSVGAGYTWSIPTAVVINYPIYESDWLTWVPTITGYSANPTNAVYRYKVNRETVICELREANAGTSNATTKTYTAPFTAMTLTNMYFDGVVHSPMNNSAYEANGYIALQSASAVFSAYRSGSVAWTATGSATINYAIVSYQIQ